MANVGGKPAFPFVPGQALAYEPGMTYREWLIGKAMEGILASELATTMLKTDTLHFQERIAEWAISCADAVVDKTAQADSILKRLEKL